MPGLFQCAGCRPPVGPAVRPVSVTAMASLHPVSGTAEEILALLREWEAAPEAAPVVIETSGSTGSPKRVVLSRAAMRASADATQARLGGPGQWVLNLPPTFVAGVQVLFRSVRAGTGPVLSTDPGAAREQLTADRTYVSLVPTQLGRALRDGTAGALCSYTAVLVGGGPLDPGDRREAEGRGIRVVQTYGMSETCGGCVYDGVPLDGVEVRIDAGQVLLRGPVLFDGYAGDPGRTAKALRDGWFHTDDLGEVVDGRLWITGRADDVVITGGVKVPAGTVASRLAGHPGIAEAAVVGTPDPEWGERLVAFVVPTGKVPAPTELRRLFPEQGWAPKQYVALGALPLLANGKPDRVALRERARHG